jgi:hypothetical protein
MALSEVCKEAIRTWEFEKAAALLGETASDTETDLIESLCQVFGDCGQLDGDMSIIIGAAAATLLPPEQEVKEEETE